MAETTQFHHVDDRDLLDNVQHKLDCGIQMLSAVRDSMEGGTKSCDSYVNAVEGITEYFQSISDTMAAVINDEAVELCERDNY